MTTVAECCDYLADLLPEWHDNIYQWHPGDPRTTWAHWVNPTGQPYLRGLTQPPVAEQPWGFYDRVAHSAGDEATMVPCMHEWPHRPAVLDPLHDHLLTLFRMVAYFLRHAEAIPPIFLGAPSSLILFARPHELLWTWPKKPSHVEPYRIMAQESLTAIRQTWGDHPILPEPTTMRGWLGQATDVMVSVMRCQSLINPRPMISHEASYPWTIFHQWLWEEVWQHLPTVPSPDLASLWGVGSPSDAYRDNWATGFLLEGHAFSEALAWGQRYVTLATLPEHYGWDCQTPDPGRPQEVLFSDLYPRSAWREWLRHTITPPVRTWPSSDASLEDFAELSTNSPSRDFSD